MSVQLFTHDEVPPLIQACGLVQVYSGGMRALNGVDFKLCPGEVVGVVGPNGSGKTTLLKILGGCLVPTNGKTSVFGLKPDARDVRARVGYVTQQCALDGEMTAWEAVVFFSRLHGLRLTGQSIFDLLRAFGLSRQSGERISSYSGGMKQRLHILLEFLHEPRLVLLDEPTSGLDPSGREILWARLQSLAREGGGVAASLHDLQEAFLQCSRVIVLAEGEVRAEGSPETLISRHGSWLWKAALARPSDWEEGLFDSLRNQAWLRALEVTADSASLWLREGAPSDEEIGALLEGAGVEILAYERRRPDLASAYHSLTGGQIPEKGTRKAAGSGQRRVRGGNHGN